MKQYFVTGTDTEVGKTYVTCQLLRATQAISKSSVGYKPIAAGCDKVNGEWVNEDALAIQQASSLKLPLSIINPISLVPPIAPHIAAAEAGVSLSEHTNSQGLSQLQQYKPDVLLMEGAGGWRLPLSESTYLPDVVAKLNMEVILVVGMKLGCLNHALLTAEAITHDGFNIKGWVANDITGEMPRYKENLATLKHALPAPLLLEVPYQVAPNSQELISAVQQLC